jgi:hypothetical protein
MKQVLLEGLTLNCGTHHCREYNCACLFLSDDILCSGGKAAAPTISTDAEYNVLVKVLLKKPASCTAGISFDLDSIAAFKTRTKHVCILPLLLTCADFLCSCIHLTKMI